MTERPSSYAEDYAARANANMIGFFRQEVPKLLTSHHQQVPDLKARFPEIDIPLNGYFNLTADPEEYINGGFINRIGGLYTKEERDFILDISKKFERVRLGFSYFSLTRANLRPLEAIRLSHSQMRTGWQRTGVPLGFNQSVSDHHQGAKALAFLLYFDDPKLELIEETCSMHDAGEPVIGDFTPFCKISKEDKGRIEELGIRLLTSKRTNPFAEMIFQANEIYEGHVPEHEDVRIKVKDCDLMEMCIEAVFLMTECPQEERAALNEKLQEFWDYVDQKLATDRAKNFFHSLKTARYRLDMNKDDFNGVIRHAHQYMILKDPDPLESDRRFRKIALEREEERSSRKKPQEQEPAEELKPK